MKEPIYKRQTVLLDSIDMTGHPPAREFVNKDHVAELTKIINGEVEGAKMDRRVRLMTADKKLYHVVDGWHHILAASEAGKKKIEAEVAPGNRADADWWAATENAEHGLKRTPGDKRQTIKTALLNPRNENFSDRFIAQHCRVDCHTVATVRSELVRVGQLRKSAVETRTGADGKTRRLPPPRPKPTPPQKPASAPVAPTPPPSQKRETLPAEPTDALGNVIPDYLRAAWECSTTAIRDITADLRRIRLIVAKAQEDETGVFLDADLQAIHAALSTALSLKASAPYAVCPWCQGGPTRKTCDGCRGAGMIGRHRYDTAVPKELK